MSFSKRFAGQPRAWIIAEVAASLIVIAVLDFITGYQIRLLPFYAGPIFIMAWFCGKKWGFAAAFFSGLIWWCANWFTGEPDLNSWIQTWEISRHVGFFLVVAFAGSALRIKSDSAAERIALLEHSHRLEREVVNISDTEQQRIGQDLHDGLCQYLAGLTCAASSLRDDLQKLHLQAEAGTADELARLLQDAVVQTRDLARKLVPAHIDRLGLILALELLADWVTRLHGVTCTFAFHGATPDCDEHTAIPWARKSFKSSSPLEPFKVISTIAMLGCACLMSAKPSRMFSASPQTFMSSALSIICASCSRNIR